MYRGPRCTAACNDYSSFHNSSRAHRERGSWANTGKTYTCLYSESNLVNGLGAAPPPPLHALAREIAGAPLLVSSTLKGAAVSPPLVAGAGSKAVRPGALPPTSAGDPVPGFRAAAAPTDAAGPCTLLPVAGVGSADVGPWLRPPTSAGDPVPGLRAAAAPTDAAGPFTLLPVSGVGSADVGPCARAPTPAGDPVPG